MGVSPINRLINQKGKTGTSLSVTITNNASYGQGNGSLTVESGGFGDDDTIDQDGFPLGGETVFIPGHGPESTFGRERRSNPYVGGT